VTKYAVSLELCVLEDDIVSLLVIFSLPGTQWGLCAGISGKVATSSSLVNLGIIFLIPVVPGFVLAFASIISRKVIVDFFGFGIWQNEMIIHAQMLG
jgi:hypothetical protein